MKKFLLVATCAFCALTVSAQRASSSSTSFFSTEKVEGGVQFGIRAGLNSANVSFSEDGYSASPKSRTSFHIGLIADIPVVESFYVQTGLYFQNKGWKVEDGEGTETYKPMYLEIPLLASYRYNFSDAAQLQINFGPYFAYGIGGKEEYESDYYDEDWDFFGDDSDWKRFDMGLQVGAGVTLAQHYYIGFAYEFGLTNIADTDDDDDYSYRNRNWMISVGYNF